MQEARISPRQPPAAGDSPGIVDELRERFPAEIVALEPTRDAVPTVWIARDAAPRMLEYLKCQSPQPYRMLYDLTAIDERPRAYRQGLPASDFTIVYHLLSFQRNADLRLKVGLRGDRPSVPTITGVFPAANWYEREVWDMFGVGIDGHPHLARILMPPWWEGHPLRKEHPARATDMRPFQLREEDAQAEQEALRFHPERWGMRRQSADAEFLFLNFGPHHPGTHGVLRLVVQLDGEAIVDVVPDIGYHHRAAEKMGERQSWHTYIPYTDRVDYLSGVVNNLAYLINVEQLAGIAVPPRAQVIRVMLCELFRIINHLVWFGTFAQDVGAMSPVFYMFTDREKALEIIEAICGFRMHPGWFRIGGVAADLPRGWDRLVGEFLDYLPPRLREYDGLVMRNRIFKQRTRNVGACTLDQAIEWGMTGPNLRACGLDWDLRKRRPYSGYEHFEFDIPTAVHGDCYDRALVRVEEMRQSLRIIRQCLEHMPSGAYKSEHPLTTPPIKDRTLHDIETLITHFLNVSWGPVIPPGESGLAIEASKGMNTYYLVSDGNTVAYRTRIRSPSFPHMQMLPVLSRGAMVADLIAILGAMDYVLADVDR